MLLVQVTALLGNVEYAARHGADPDVLEAELLATLRKEAGTMADIRAAMPQLRAALASHYSGPFYCA